MTESTDGKEARKELETELQIQLLRNDLLKAQIVHEKLQQQLAALKKNEIWNEGVSESRSESSTNIDSGVSSGWSSGTTDQQKGS